MTKVQKRRLQKLRAIQKGNREMAERLFQLKRSIAKAKREGNAAVNKARRKCAGKCERDSSPKTFVGPKYVPSTQTRTTVTIGNHFDNLKRYKAVKTKGLNADPRVLRRVRRHLKDAAKAYSKVRKMHRSKYYKYPVYVPKRKGNPKFPKMLMKRDRERLKRLYSGKKDGLPLPPAKGKGKGKKGIKRVHLVKGKGKGKGKNGIKRVILKGAKKAKKGIKKVKKAVKHAVKWSGRKAEAAVKKAGGALKWSGRKIAHAVKKWSGRK